MAREGVIRMRQHSSQGILLTFAALCHQNPDVRLERNMPAREAWKVSLSLHDILDIEMRSEGRSVRSFSVHLRHFDGMRWRSVWRTDTAHGRLHVHSTTGRILHLERTASPDYTEAFTRAQEYARTHWESLLARWRAHEGRRGP